MWGRLELHRRQGLKGKGLVNGCSREHVLLLAEGIGATEDDLFGDGLLENLVVELVLQGVGLRINLGLERLLGVLHAGLHDVGEEQSDVEDVLASFLMGILRIQVGVGLTTTTALLDLGQHLALGLELGFEQLALCATIRNAIVAHSKRETIRDVVFTGVGLAPRKDALRGLGTLIHLEGLVLQFRAYPTTKVAVFD